MKSIISVLLLSIVVQVYGFSMTMNSAYVTRRAFFSKTTATTAAASIAAAVGVSQPAFAAPEIFNTENGIKYAVLKEPKQKGSYPQQGDIVAIEYTGYLVNGQIWDSTHSEGKSNALLFKLGTDVVIDGLNEMVSNMVVGQKVQAIIPPKLAFGDKGLCLDDGECLIKPGQTLVYDVYLKKSSIPPP